MILKIIRVYGTTWFAYNCWMARSYRLQGRGGHLPRTAPLARLARIVPAGRIENRHQQHGSCCPLTAGAWMGCAAGLVPAYLMQFACMHEAWHIISHHLFPIAGSILLGALMGYMMLRSRPESGIRR